MQELPGLHLELLYQLVGDVRFLEHSRTVVSGRRAATYKYRTESGEAGNERVIWEAGTKS